MSVTSPHLVEALHNIRSGDLVAARRRLAEIAANPGVHGISWGESRAAFSRACELALLPDDFPPDLRSALVEGILTGSLDAALLRVMDPLGEDPGSTSARLALRDHAPLLYGGLSRVRDAGATSAPTPSGLSVTLAWPLLLLALGVLRACAGA